MVCAQIPQAICMLPGTALGKIAVITPQGVLDREIPLTKTQYPTNLDFGVNGDLLYVSGRCGSAPWRQGDGCVEVVSIPAVAPTPAPTTPEPTPAPTTPQPTPAPAPSCCKWASNCGGSCATGWCSSSQSNYGGCGGNWCAPTLLGAVSPHE